MTIETIFLALVISFFVLLFIYYLLINSGNRLKKKFDAMGSLIGKTRMAITDIAGEPSATVRTNALTTCSWYKGNYSMTLTFDAEDRVINIQEVNSGFWG
ncbi:MAG: hypothetical protein ACKO5C_04685 [Ferruginibacter sp.]